MRKRASGTFIDAAADTMAGARKLSVPPAIVRLAPSCVSRLMSKNNQKNSGAAMQQIRSQVTERDGLFELEAGSDVLDSPRYNHDMAPTKVHERTWNKWHITALWVGMSICVPTYTLGGVLTAYFGLSVGEALLAILFANIIVLIPLTLNAFPGTKYGIPFPVLLRSSFGILGSNVPCLIRALVACGWFGIQTMFGGLAIHLFLGSVFEGWKSLGGTGR